MSELQNVQHMLEEAKGAASAGDLALADALLQDVAGIQEAELGSLHPELANTINNLAIVAEMEGRLEDAESYYRRAAAITAASLPADDPIVASSRKHLEDFCREHGLLVDLPAVTPTEPRLQYGSDSLADDPIVTSAPVGVAEIDLAGQSSTHAPDTPSVPRSTTDTVDRSSAPATTGTRSLALVVIALVALVGVVLLVMRPWSDHESTPDQQAAPAATAAPQPEPPQTATPASSPSEQPQPPTAAARDDHSTPPAATRASGEMSLVTAQLCQTFSAGGNWRCDPAAQSVPPGPIVLYTRVKSPRQAVLIHRWFRGDTLRQTSRLTIQANPTDGYRTYSRQTVRSGEDWRVEVKNTAGDLLYEQRVSVR